jgi:hypothetical protein
MHTVRRYKKSDGTEGYRIGFYDPVATRERWELIGEVGTLAEALEFVSYLNGGQKPPGPIEPR